MRALRRILFAALVLALGVAAIPTPPAQAAVFASVAIAPPEIPVYVQPPIPGPGYVWVPGYWAYEPVGYFWVPGTWVFPPEVGLLWTPGYWDWDGGVYLWRVGYWGPTVGFYGGINYGFGYFGAGYAGGYWAGGRLFYNTAYCNLGGVHITNVYNRTVVYEHTGVSYHGGNGGMRVQPTAQELAAGRERHVAMTSEQSRHVNAAAADPAQRASANHGRPAVSATARPGDFGHAQTHTPSASPRTGGGRGTVNPPAPPSAGNGRATVNPTALPRTESHRSTVNPTATPSAGGNRTVVNPATGRGTSASATAHSQGTQPRDRSVQRGTPRTATPNQPGGNVASAGARPHGHAPQPAVASQPSKSAPPQQKNRSSDNGKTEGH